MPAVRDTIFALSSGSAPSAIAVMRVSGPRAQHVILQSVGVLPAPRRASFRRICDERGSVLDHALVLWFPGPNTATGEDLAEFHLHGGRAVIRAVSDAFEGIAGVRKAEPGEFTRRAFANGCIDLAEAEGLADLLEAETELQRRNALALSSGAFSAQVSHWTERALMLSAQVESALDFSDEGDVGEVPAGLAEDIEELTGDIAHWLAAPQAERLKEGFRVVLAGPPNSGKSTLFNILVGEEAAIATPIAGTTRDVLERSCALGGIAFTFVDTAGLHEGGDDVIEAIGIAKAKDEVARADCVLWFDPFEPGPAGCWPLCTKADLGIPPLHEGVRAVSAKTGTGIDDLRRDLMSLAQASMPKPGLFALNARQRACIEDAHNGLEAARGQTDLLLIAENLRQARLAFDRLTGRASTEDMLDALFGRFCIGK